MNRKTQIIATLLMAGCAGLTTGAFAGPGSGPNGPFNSGGAYGGFGPYSPYISRGIPIEGGQIIEKRTTYIVEPARTERTVWVERRPVTAGQAVVDVVTTPVRVVRDVAIVGGRGARTVIGAPEAVGEQLSPAPGERVVTVKRVCYCKPKRHHVATVTTRTIRYARAEPVGERTYYTTDGGWSERPYRSTGQVILDTVTTPFRVVRDVAVVGGRAAGTVIRTPGRIIRHERPAAVAERTQVTEQRKTSVHHAGKTTHHVVHHTTTVTTRHNAPPAVAERREVRVVGGRRTITTPARTAPSAVGEAPTNPGPTVSPAYPNSENDYANPYR